jgi:hypothetical protein
MADFPETVAFNLQLDLTVYRESSSSRQRHRMGSLFWGLVALFLGWVPFVYWWREVLASEEKAVFMGLLLWLLAAIAILALATSLWIVHNKRLARRGRRGLATRFFTLEHVSDRLGRSLELPDHDELRSSPRVVIRAEEDLKTYSIAHWGAPPR